MIGIYEKKYIKAYSKVGNSVIFSDLGIGWC